MKKVKIALIGAGEIAQNFHIPVLKNLDNVELVAIIDIVGSKAKYVAEKFDIPYHFDSIEALDSIEGLNAVDICTSTDSHIDIALKFIEKGIDVFIEKPVGRNYEESKKLADAQKKSDSKVMIGMNLRFRRDSKILKNSVHTGDVGEIFYIKSGWLQQKREHQWLGQLEKSGGGVLLDLGISMIDLIMWITDFSDVKSVRADNFHHLTSNVEDVSVSTIHFANNSIATLETSWSLFRSKKVFYCDVYGSQGRASIDPFKLYRSKGEVFEQSEKLSYTDNVSVLKRAFESELKHFVHAVMGYGPVHSTPGEAVKVMQVIEALYLSAKNNSDIIL